MMRRLGLLLIAGLLAVLTGCATTGGAPKTAAQKADPWENWNRKVYAFNESVDEAVLKPVATAYRNTVPELVRTGINNVLGNIGDAWSAANHLLQGKLQSGLEMGMRVLTNTVFGLGGLLDPASEMGLTKRSEDFGQTLGRWGLPNGPYMVLPLLGPSTVRDATGLLADRQVAPAALPPTTGGQYSVAALELLNVRSNLLATTQLLDQAALDKYSFVRDAYLARRRDALYDGAPPMENYDDEAADPPPKAPAAAPAATAPK
jgi:phospholipid-binding lipoprotein MlaA